LIWFGSGTNDIFYGGNKAFSAKLTTAGIPHDFYELPGYHVLPVFRRELIALLPKLFASRAPATQSGSN
jgi:enterochelin esterase-like enzyme